MATTPSVIATRIALLLIPLVACAQSPEADSARIAVQRFYDWYVPMAAKPSKIDPWMRATRDGGIAFDSTLTSWLRSDSTARARAKGEVAGLEYDPYTNSQDACDRYVADSIKPRASGYRVFVRGIGGCAAHREPDVIVDIERRLTKWTITDFASPADWQSLLARLRALHSRRR